MNDSLGSVQDKGYSVTGSTRKPNVLLSLVKERSGGARFSSLENLTAEQRELAVQYQRLISHGSVLVGVVTGAASWDVRPVILQRGVMTITRMFSPELLSSVQLSDPFKSYIFHVERLSPGVQGLSCGSGEGYAWVSRRYFKELLPEVAQSIPLSEKISLIGTFLLEIEKLHNVGIVHGHINPSNVSYDNGQLILLDHGFQTHDPSASHPPTLAPELRSGVAGELNATTATDMYGVGLVIKRLLGSELGLEFGNLIEVLLLNDPRLRPKLPQILSHFVSSEAQQAVVPPNKETVIEIAQDKASPKPAAKRFLKIVLPSALALLVLGYFAYPFVRATIEQFSSKGPEARYEKFWSSGQAPLMQQVVVEALHGNETAKGFVLEKLQSGATIPGVQSRLFQIGLHPLWQAELTDRDKEALLSLGLGYLVPAQERTLPDFSKLHPGVLLAIAGSMGTDDGFEPFQSVPLKKLSSLPIPYGAAFLALSKTGVVTLKEPVSLALAHILTEDVSNRVVSVYLGNGEDGGASIARLEILAPLFEIFEGLDKKVFDAISSSSKDGPYSWFSKDVVAQWGNVSSRTKLLLFTGVVPTSFSREQWLDLLRFPRSDVREKAKQNLLGLLSEDLQGVLNYLALPECLLTRTQSISLVSALGLPPDSAHNFILQWFGTNPDPTAVLKLLIAIGHNEKHQAFQIEAARFLLDKDWKASVEDLAGLASSSEPLARTLAYVRLRIDVPEEREILKKLSELEPVPRIKEQLLQRLSEGNP